ncbi:LCP family protein [Conexibacter sp. SYSU D00693]|uniref:LCP family protein n=1 Tax=Conexibacter sp. SYSU D00693 TaxID=2812560 RepID=UPI00196A96BA|nr:LCP family protein [Conexibacter sp. SYSU D00693]
MLRALLAGLLIMVAAAATTATTVLLEVDTAAGIFDEESVDIPEIQGALDDVDPGGPQTILLLGSDRRYADIKTKAPVRSDTMILVRLDPSKGATAVMSLPRDLKVRIPGHGTDKLNAAYAIGQEKLVLRTIRGLLAPASDTGSFPINHVVNVNFGGFRRAVNRLGCVYADVDRKYFNDNDPPFGGGPNYATIDVSAGYQKLCGQDALDYVRYRHFDSDIVRAARQQEFLRQAKDQVGVSKIFSDRKELLRIFARYTQTDIRGTKAILRLLKLAVESARNPVQEVQFPGDVKGDYVEATDEGLRRAVDRFLNAKGSPGRRGEERRTSSARTSASKRRRARRAGLPPGMVVNRTANEDVAVRLATSPAARGMPVVFPKAQLSTATLQGDDTRAYTIVNRQGRRYPAYRMVFKTNEIGQYYGVQGTTWQAAPILDSPSERRRIGGRRYELFFDADRLRLVAWRTKGAVYWVSNSLLQTVSNRQMLALAQSLSRIGAK